ncbi:MAG: hypothetical protein PHY08_09870 [Candidatus Cloacimonetes bacterium]|jgi:hypothetical protein|nr:hypothetical protein [Candidatus Cloacimonadota bacterium]
MVLSVSKDARTTIKGQLISRFDNLKLNNNQTKITLLSDLFINLNPTSGIYILKLKDLDSYTTTKILLIK